MSAPDDRPRKPPLGRIKLLHQAYAGTGVCLYCKKPMDDWEPMQECPKRTGRKDGSA